MQVEIPIEHLSFGTMRLSQLIPIHKIPANLLNWRLALLLLLIEIVFSTLGYMYLEGYRFNEAVYMTIITISTVGFTEVRPLSDTGRLFTSILILVNIGIFSYLLAAFSFYIIEGQIFRSMHDNQIRQAIDQLDRHIILCGFGRYGRVIGQNLLDHQLPVVVIEQDESVIESIQSTAGQMLYIHADATQDETLVQAGISRARAIITALSDDSDNLFIVFSARQLNPGIQIISRAVQPRSEEKLHRAGANNVVLPDQIGGFYMATLISKPGAVEFFTFITNEYDGDVGFEELSYNDIPQVDRGTAIRDLHLRSQTGVNIIGYRTREGQYIVNPDPDTALEPGDSFIILGSTEQLRAFRKLLGKEDR